MSQEGLTEKSVGELVQQASRQTAGLVRQELQLALGETVDALVQKADVKAQLSAKVDQAKQRPAPGPVRPGRWPQGRCWSGW